MKILLVGYGKMGKTIEGIAIERGHSIIGRLDNASELAAIDSGGADVAIEFTQPDAAFDNLKTCIDKEIPVISGTTGWLDKRAELEQYCKNKNGAFFYASNFSIGVNLFFKLNQYLAQLMNSYSEYGVQMEEIHHTQKRDKPSGTAITLAEGLINHLSRKNNWVSDTTPKKEDINIISKREPEVPGTHTIQFTSEIDDISITHQAHSRKGFALGAVLVAEWIQGKKGVFDMEDFLPKLP